MIDFQPQIILESVPLITRGLLMTLKLSVFSLMIGMLIAMPLARLRASRRRWQSAPVWAYTYFFRGTPMLLQLLVLYYGLAQFEAVRESPMWPYLRDPYWCALIAFSLNTGAYTTEILAGSIRGIAYGEIEAARAYGMSESTLYRRIVLPSAMRRALPAYGNEVILLLQGSSIASAVTLVDLTGAGRNIYSDYYAPFEAFLFIGLVYMTLTFILVGVFRHLELRYLAYLAPRATH
ncbi:amino acid ABC transporter permease [Pseudomonas soli]|uniref:ABC transporter permease n=1 Tax=Pseudomonas soli TaxID=1306993 RepID=UPI000D9A6E7A|nr:ABC transporter permease [Pseudomonas soli]MDW9405732.1 ABC transporter permease subunit [Pseudomonas soli]PYC44560.1 amino acid ABC transporter permease [Pseudomonas soli]